MSASMANLQLVINTDRDRYELWSGAEFIGLEGYELADDGIVVLQHTVIEEKYGRQGYARAMVTLILDDIREHGQKIRPLCTYVQSYLERFPEYNDLVAD